MAVRRDDPPHGIGQDHPGTEPKVPGCRALLAAYQRCLEAAPPPPHLFFERTSRHIPFYPRVACRFAVRFFIRQHIFRTLDGLTRAYQRHAALAESAPGTAGDDRLVSHYDTQLDLIERYRQSLGKRPPARVLVVGVVFGAFVASFILVDTVPFPRRGEAIAFLRAASAEIIPPDISELWRVSANAARDHDSSALPMGQVTTGSGAIDDAPDTEDMRVIGLSLLAVSASLLIIFSLLPMGSFTVKRLVFNRGPEAMTRVIGGSRRENSTMVDGIYEEEHQLFTKLDTLPMVEVPFDLLRRGVILLPILIVPLAFTAALMREMAMRQPSPLGIFEGYWPANVTFVLLFALPIFQFAELLDIWRVRRSRAYGVSPSEAKPVRNNNVYVAVLVVLIVSGHLSAWAISGNPFLNPAEWATVSLVMIAVGMAAIWFGRLALFGRSTGIRERLACRTPGYVLVLVGVSGMFGLHHGVIACAVGVITLALGIVVESVSVRLDRRSTWRKVATVAALPVAATFPVGVAVWISLEPIGPFPVEAEQQVIADIAVPSWCARLPPSYHPEAIPVGCVITPTTYAYLYGFSNPHESASAFNADIVSKVSQSEPCDFTGPRFEGTGPLFVAEQEVGRFACYSHTGRPRIAWLRFDRPVYGELEVEDWVPWTAEREQLYLAWELLKSSMT